MALTLKILKELFIIDPDAGTICWASDQKRGGKIKSGQRAGYLSERIYRIICINYIDYFEHNVMWLYVNGSFPKKGYEVDHINRDRSDNRIANLRICTRSQNNANMKLRANNTTGVRGVHFNERRKKYIVQVTCGGRTKSLGGYESLEKAKKVAESARNELFGEFAYHPTRQ